MIKDPRYGRFDGNLAKLRMKQQVENEIALAPILTPALVLDAPVLDACK